MSDAITFKPDFVTKAMVEFYKQNAHRSIFTVAEEAQDKFSLSNEQTRELTQFFISGRWKKHYANLS